MGMYSVYGISLENGELKEFFTRGTKSMLDLQNSLYNQGYELDEQTTLENYLSHTWVDAHIIEVVNDYTIMSCPLARLLDDYAIYDMVA